METLRIHIEKIIKETFDIIDNIYKTNQETEEGNFVCEASRLVFPKYRNNSVRLSIQELRFLFIERFNKYCDNNHIILFYSIETPTEESYDFCATPKKHCESHEGRSSLFDMVIYNVNKERVCLIEFKTDNSDAEQHEKDFLKLSVEGGGKLCYLISIAKAYNSSTLGESNNPQGIIHMFNKVAENKEICFDNITYICHCLEDHNGKGFKTIYAGTVKSDFGWEKKDEIFNQ